MAVPNTSKLPETSTPKDEKDGFFIPSYLEESRYAERLREDQVNKIPPPSSRSASQPASLSTSSSSVNLHDRQRFPPSHRGLTYDVVEIPPSTSSTVEEPPQPLPSKWDAAHKGPGLEILNDGLQVKYNGARSSDEGTAIRADHPMPTMAGIYYFEVNMLTKQREGLVSVGFVSPKVALTRVPGWEPNSWGYHGDDGKIHTAQQAHQTGQTGKNYKEPFHGGDTIGCGINFRTGTCFFTKNGMNFGTAFKDLKSDKLYYPAIGMKKTGEQVKVNFGQTPFLFDIKSVYDKEREAIRSDIKATDIGNLYPPYSEAVLVHKLIAQYLANEGYVAAARAFAQEVNVESGFLKGQMHGTSSNELEIEEDIHAVNRQEIRTAIMNGDIDSALQLAESHYPTVLEQNSQIHFRLKCLKFLEIMRLSLEEQTRIIEKPKSRIPGSFDYDDDVFSSHEMELDESRTNGHGNQEWNSGSGMQIDDDDMVVDKGKGRSVTNIDLFTYGQKLQKEYAIDTRKGVREELQKTLGLIAYTNVHESPLKELLDVANRRAIAEDLNKAILGKYPTLPRC
jgi:hypothetical protein